MFACSIDLLDNLRQCRFLPVRYFFQVVPEGIFEAHARLVSANDDGAFGD
jgi:hypothetical protein